MPTLTVKNPIVEMDGDEMTRVMWQMVKDKLLLPYLDMNIEYYDLGLAKRDETDDQITVDAGRAIMKHTVGVKCATITPDAQRMQEYGLKQQWKSPNGTIRAMLDGTVFRCPIITKNIVPAVHNWRRPIVIARHAYGGLYKGVEMRIADPGTVELVYTPADGGPEQRATVHQFKSPGVVMGMHNLDGSITSFARACFTYALDRHLPVMFATKDTISKTYHARFRILFDEVFEREFKDRFEQAGLTYMYTLIDDAVARIMKSEGGILWACRNYDGDVMSDMVGSSFGSLAMMTSDLISPNGYFEYEAAHGTVQRHYYLHLKGEPTSTNSMALIFAWTGGLKKRAEIDGTPEVAEFARKLERAAVETIESGIMTKDLIPFANPRPAGHVLTEQFIDAVRARLDQTL